MAWRPHGHARVNANQPSAWGDCDRCGMLYNLDDLNYQFDWRGPRLANLRIKVCRRCMDKPFPFWRPVILPPDPVARTDPRPEAFDAEMGPTPAVWSPREESEQTGDGSDSGVFSEDYEELVEDIEEAIETGAATPTTGE